MDKWMEKWDSLDKKGKMMVVVAVVIALGVVSSVLGG